jgi:predicted Zn-dependent protease with MMP-like domain
MYGSGLAQGWQKATLGVVAGSCLALTACAAASSGDTPGQPQQAVIPAATMKFCRHIATAMNSLDSQSVTQDMSVQQAHALVDQVMERSITSFTTLAGQAPSRMRATILDVVADFRAYQKVADKESVDQILATMSTATPTRQASYEKLLTYTSDNC